MTRVPAQPPHKLFALLRHLTIDQKTLAARLQLSHTLISLWAHGKKPIPEKHKAAITAMIQEAFGEANAQYERKVETAARHYHALAAQSGPGETEELRVGMDRWQHTIDAWKASIATYSRMVEEWHIEEYARCGQLYQTLYQYCRTLGQYGNRQPQPLSTDQRAEMRAAHAAIGEHLRMLAQLDTAPTALLAQLEEQQRALPQRLQAVR